MEQINCQSNWAGLEFSSFTGAATFIFMHHIKEISQVRLLGSSQVNNKFNLFYVYCITQQGMIFEFKYLCKFAKTRWPKIAWYCRLKCKTISDKSTSWIAIKKVTAWKKNKSTGYGLQWRFWELEPGNCTILIIITPFFNSPAKSEKLVK